MKKILSLAICLLLTGCYTPLNNSGVSTNKAWLEIPAKKTDFQGDQYDSCYQFRLHFIPTDAEAQLDLHDSCIDSCCWRSDKQEVVLDFNKNFEKNLRFYGRAAQYTPEKITLTVSHSNLLNNTTVKVSPRGAISANGTVKLKSKIIENPARLVQIEQQARRLQAQHNALLAERNIPQEDETVSVPVDPQAQLRAQQLLQRLESPRIDHYFYQLNKTYQQRGYIFLVSDRIYVARPVADGTFQVTCRAKVRSGTQPAQLQNRTISCGIWKANLVLQTVSPQDSTARKIKAQAL